MKSLAKTSLVFKLEPQGPALASLLLACAATANAAPSCDGLAAEIDAKIRAAGVASFALKTVDADAVLPGKVVGSCGGKKIVYQKTESDSQPLTPRAATVLVKAKPSGPAKTPAPALLTECKDGSMAVGATCGR